jgi:excisionase family DNA binding protein
MRDEMSTVSSPAKPASIGARLRGMMTTKQAAERLGISLRHLMHLIAQGKLPGSYKLGMQRFIPSKAVEARVRQVEKWRASHAHK